jgi:hypothetical protein
MNRVTILLLRSIAFDLLLVLVGVVVLNGTYYGRERVRRPRRGARHGEWRLMVGRIDGNLLDRFDPSTHRQPIARGDRSTADRLRQPRCAAARGESSSGRSN